MEHTQEPWRVGKSGAVVADYKVPEMGGSDDVDYYGGHLIAESVVQRNAVRIVSCVNACAGIPSEDLKKVQGDVAPVFTLLMQYAKERDTAWEELRKIREAIKANPEESTFDEVMKVVSGRDELLVALKRLEDACDKRASCLSGEAYLVAERCKGMREALYEMDNARSEARETIAKAKAN